MKRCSQCHFTFDDYVEVCDFDGTELTPHPDPAPLSDRIAPPRPPFFHSTKFKVGVASLTLVGLGWVTVSTWRSRTSPEATQEGQALIAQRFDHVVKHKPRSSSTSARRAQRVRRPETRMSHVAISKHRAISRRTFAAAHPAHPAPKKESKVTAVFKKSGSILKKAVSVLKKPFDF